MRSSPAAKRRDPSEPAGASKSTPGNGSLVIVATPIGNLGDIAERALDALRGADVIACEDKRVTVKLLSAYDIRTPMLPYHDHNADRMRPALIQRLQAGEIVALVSDAGTPLISDPGYKLVQAAIGAGVAVTAIPGPSALLTALVLSGLPSDRFFFAGFLPPRGPARRQEIRSLAGIPGTLVFYEAPSRLTQFLADLAAILGPRPAAVARELTKKFEEVRRDTLDRLAAAYEAGAAPRGEIVVVVGPPRAEAAEEDATGKLDAALEAALAAHSLREAAALVAADTGLPRRVVYARALSLRKPERPV
jgi:16S rRNA (cytidine1402-2'-O)-methyltransferase